MNNEILERAFAEISRRRNNAFAENERRISEINEKIPEIRLVNDTIFNTGRELISMFADKNNRNAEQKIQQLRKYNTDAQTMARQKLVQYGYPPDYLDIHYTCPVCKDTGYNNSVYCECFKRLCASISAERINQNTQLKLSSFDTFDLSYYKGEEYTIMAKIFSYAQDYAYKFTINSPNILMLGGTGLGKTHLSLAIANEVIEKGYNVIYDSAINILQIIEREHFSHEHSLEMINNVLGTDLLILDDLGTEYRTQFYTSTIYNIVNTRLNRSLPTIMSTNLDSRGIGDKYDDRVASRIITNYTVLRFVGEDVRFLLKRKKSKDTPF
ncbi:MAG: ATP-binding protein [Ruminococcus sp.]|nr:ATP-binding protein [Ruminococcus sp.]